MTTETASQSHPEHGSGRRRVIYLFLFLVLIVLASFSGQWVDGIALAQTVPGGTITPGGTLPAPPTPAPGTALVRVIHLAPFDSTVANTAVDICTQSGNPVPGLTGLVYLTQSGYVTLTPGAYDWTVETPGCGAVALDLPAFTLQPGMVLTLLVVGGGNQPLTYVWLVDQAGQQFVYLPLITKV